MKNQRFPEKLLMKTGMILMASVLALAGCKNSSSGSSGVITAKGSIFIFTFV